MADHQSQKHIAADQDHGDDCSEISDTSSEAKGIDESVQEDMIQLEETFDENGMNFRLIDRIGEGSI